MPSSSETPTQNPTRELAAIMFSDIAGYTAIMGRDEQNAIRAPATHRALLRSLMPRFNGRLIGEIGDGTLSSFHSALDAVNCAREIQAALTDAELRLRIGIHVGDVLFADNNVLGDGVNVASRIHALAAPGGICISERVYEDIRNKPDIRARDLGIQTLKNVDRPIRVYALVPDGAAAAPAPPWLSGRRSRGIAAMLGSALVLAAVVYAVTRARPLIPSNASKFAAPRQIRSIAVLPLENLSGDASQEFFADGMTEELITDLAKISALRVISRTSVMQFKGERRKSLPEIAKALDVDAVVEGSVLRVGDKVRITAQLVDAPADKHLWAQSYERDSRDVLAMQDEIASAIANQVNVELTPQEQQQLTTANPVNPEAYEAYLKGRYYLYTWTDEGEEKARKYFQQSIDTDPSFAQGYAGLSEYYSNAEDVVSAAGPNFPSVVMPKAKVLAERALQLNPSLAEAHEALALVKLHYDFDWVSAEREFRRAIALNPGYATAHFQYGEMLLRQGRLAESAQETSKAQQLDPLSPALITNAAGTLLFVGQPEQALALCRQSAELSPEFRSKPFVFRAGVSLHGEDRRVDRRRRTIPAGKWGRGLCL